MKAKVENGASFVVKIDENPNKLKSELGGYRKVSARLDHKYYLQPFNAVTEPTTLLPDWWGAFALPCEVDAKTLLAEGPAAGSELAKLYQDLWNKCLFNLYGPTTVKKLGLKELFRKGTGKNIVDSWASIGRYAERFESCAPGVLKQVQLLVEQFSLKDKEGWRSRKIATPWVEQVHGDLNCRNILYDAKNGSFFVIDFPNIEPNSLAYDFAKAEAELMLIMLDWGTGKDCDFDRILAWMRISSQLSGTFIPSSTSSTDVEINRAFEGAIAIRELYRSRAEKNGDVEVAYLTFLLSRLLRYLSYQDLTIAKRHFAFVWASQLAQALPIM